MYTTREALAYNGKLPVQQNPAGVTPQLLDLLAMQKVDADKKAAAQALAMSSGQANMPTVAQGIEQQALNSARGEIAQKLGLAGLAQQQAPQGPAPQQPPAQGIASAPSPLPQSYQEGGIVAFAGTTDGSDVKDPSLYERYVEPSVNVGEAAAAIGVPVWLYKQIADVASATGTTVREILAHPPAQLARSLGPLARNVGSAALTPATGAVLAGGVPATRFANDVMANNAKLRESYNDMGAMGGAMDPDGALAAAIYNQRNASGEKPVAKPAATSTDERPYTERNFAVRKPSIANIAEDATLLPRAPVVKPAAGLADAAKADMSAVPGMGSKPSGAPVMSPENIAFIQAQKDRIAREQNLDPETLAAAREARYDKRIGVNNLAAIENQKARTAGLQALYDRQVEERPSSFITGLQRMGENVHALPGQQFQGVSSAITKAREGYTTQDIANKVSINTLTEAMEKAIRDNDIGGYNAAVAGLDEAKARIAEGGKQGTTMADVLERTQSQKEINYETNQTRRQDAMLRMREMTTAAANRLVDKKDAASRQAFEADQKQAMALAMSAATKMMELPQNIAKYKGMSVEEVALPLYQKFLTELTAKPGAPRAPAPTIAPPPPGAVKKIG